MDIYDVNKASHKSQKQRNKGFLLGTLGLLAVMLVMLLEGVVVYKYAKAPTVNNDEVSQKNSKIIALQKQVIAKQEDMIKKLEALLPKDATTSGMSDFERAFRERVRDAGMDPNKAWSEYLSTLSEQGLR